MRKENIFSFDLICNRTRCNAKMIDKCLRWKCAVHSGSSNSIFIEVLHEWRHLFVQINWFECIKRNDN